MTPNITSYSSKIFLANVSSSCINGDFSTVNIVSTNKCVKGTAEGRDKSLNSRLALFIRFDYDDSADSCKTSSASLILLFSFHLILFCLLISLFASLTYDSI